MRHQKRDVEGEGPEGPVSGDWGRGHGRHQRPVTWGRPWAMTSADPDLLPDSLSSMFADCFATAAQTRPVLNVAFSSSHEAAIECFLGSLAVMLALALPCHTHQQLSAENITDGQERAGPGQGFPLPRRRFAINLAHWGIESSRVGHGQCLMLCLLFLIATTCVTLTGREGGRL